MLIHHVSEMRSVFRDDPLTDLDDLEHPLTAIDSIANLNRYEKKMCFKLNEFEVQFVSKPACDHTFGWPELRVFVAKGDLSLDAWLTTDGWRNIYDLRIYPRKKGKYDVWISTYFTCTKPCVPNFDQHLDLMSEILKTMFDRIEAFDPASLLKATEWKWPGTFKNERTKTFMEKIQQPHSLCTIRNSYMMKRAFHIWIHHYYSPDTSYGFMYKKSKLYV
tara:strand:- start:291 stop:947 length:657 start_codon:yes stop_codon:yes gene_type:complete